MLRRLLATIHKPGRESLADRGPASRRVPPLTAPLIERLCDSRTSRCP